MSKNGKYWELLTVLIFIFGFYGYSSAEEGTEKVDVSERMSKFYKNAFQTEKKKVNNIKKLAVVVNSTVYSYPVTESELDWIQEEFIAQIRELKLFTCVDKKEILIQISSSTVQSLSSPLVVEERSSQKKTDYYAGGQYAYSSDMHFSETEIVDINFNTIQPNELLTFKEKLGADAVLIIWVWRSRWKAVTLVDNIKGYVDAMQKGYETPGGLGPSLDFNPSNRVCLAAQILDTTSGETISTGFVDGESGIEVDLKKPKFFGTCALLTFTGGLALPFLVPGWSSSYEEDMKIDWGDINKPKLKVPQLKDDNESKNLVLKAGVRKILNGMILKYKYQ
ncbi:MAG: hypothetical protein AB1349_03935 [Elusimicrobiota bacterium]